MFSNEADLRDTLAKRRLHFPPSFDTVLVRTEVPMGTVIPDLVYLGFEGPTPISPVTGKVTYRHAHILWLLRRWGKLRPATLARRCFETSPRITRIIDDLVKWRLADALGSGSLTLNSTYSRLNSRVVAVETKLQRWAIALKQAQQYRNFADAAIVAVPERYIPRPSQALASFKKSGIGLCGVSLEKTKWVILPHLRNAHSPCREYLLATAYTRPSHTSWSCL